MRTTLQRVEAYVHDEREISPEQRDAILSESRLTIVRACPGSGKTRAFAARFAWDVATAPSRRAGVAAISFTNVAQEEVRRRVRQLQVPDGYPHFVGTIDAFLLRYVVRRFGGSLVNLKRFSHPVPDRDYSVQRASRALNGGKFDRLSAFRINADHSGKAQVEHFSKDRQITVVPPPFAAAVIKAKKDAWAEGELTYSDVVAIGWWILSSKEIARIVARRYPRILIDEFQDTTGVRARCLRLLVQSDCFERAFVVGDPDQCIMEFAGAKPELFDEFERIHTDVGQFSFTRCYRFHHGIAAVTAPLRESRTPVNGQRPISGRSATLLLTHGFTQQPKDGVVATVASQFTDICSLRGIAASEGIVLTWNDSDVQRLGGLQKKRMPLRAPAYGQVMGAIRARSQGLVLDAFRRTESLLARLVFGRGRPPSAEDLDSLQLDTRAWRRTVMRTLGDVSTAAKSETVADWASRIKLVFEREFERLTGKHEKLGKKFRLEVEGTKKLLDSPAMDYLPDLSVVATTPVSNVHQVKGQEFPAVCVYVPADRKGTHPADAVLVAIQPPLPDTMSARRVLYVGATRAQDLLVVAIPNVWVAELEKDQNGRAFLQAFDSRGKL